MTRINCVPVEELCRQHLIAEYRELPRVFGMAANAERWNRIKSLPEKYVLGEGHIKFFYNKLEYCAERHRQLVKEMFRRNYKPVIIDPDIPWRKSIPSSLWGNWEPTENAIKINRERIKERMPSNV
jgi:deoxyribonuclease (pyrimidine dimer)